MKQLGYLVLGLLLLAVTCGGRAPPPKRPGSDLDTPLQRRDQRGYRHQAHPDFFQGHEPGLGLKYLVPGMVITVGGLFGLAVGHRLTFKAGDPIKSAELNQHFSTLKSAIAALKALAKLPVTTWTMKGSRIRQMGPTARR